MSDGGETRLCVCGLWNISAYGPRCPSCPAVAAAHGGLGEREWAALGAAEEVIYLGDRGANPLTSVMDAETAGVQLVEMWKWAEMHIADTSDPNINITGETARRVAAAMKMLAFGY